MKIKKTLTWLAGSLVLMLVTLRVVEVKSLVFAADACTEYQCNPNDDENTYYNCIAKKKSCLEGKLDEVQNQKVSLSNTISILNGQISIQQLQIDQLLAEIAVLDEEITGLSQRISGLNLSLDRLSSMLVDRIRTQYKRGQVSPLTMLLASDSFSGFLTQMRYLRLAGHQTALAMTRAENQRLEYDEQKTLKEVKQEEVEAKRSQLQAEKIKLDSQKADQQYLLNQTKNDEAVYQSELAKTLAELQAIQSIIAGNGSESEVGGVSEGDKIASIIVGSSACSTGTHLHFEVVKNGVHFDPSGYLKTIDAQWNNSPDGSFGFGGGWNWPVNNPAKINQGYGMTYYARANYYGGAPHTGIDMASKSSDYTVKAVRDGTLYRGSIACGGGQLRYVRVDHANDDVDTYYLHINY